jgi:hypothetical protein
VRGRGDISGEEVFEKTLPEDIRGIADDAEYGELEDLVDVEGERRLETQSVQVATRQGSGVWRTLSLYEERACASTLDVMLSTAPCSVCDTIDMAAVDW